MSKDSISEQLSELFELFKTDALSKEEYEILKSELLSEGNISDSEGKSSLSSITPDPKNNAKKSVLEDRLRAEPLNVEILHEYAQFLFDNQISDEVITVCLKILVVNEIDWIAKDLLFQSYFKLNKFKDALEIGEKLLQDRPTDIILLESLAKISKELGNSERTNDFNEKILSLQPSNAFALYNKALVLLEKNQIEKAIELFKRLNQKGDNSRITLIYSGIGKALDGDFNAAIDSLRPILRKEDQNNIDNNRGFLYLAYCLCQSSAGILKASQWFSQIDFEILKYSRHELDEQTVVKIVEVIINHSLKEIDPASDINRQILNTFESYLHNDYLTKNSNLEIAGIWFSIGNKQIELEWFTEAINAFQKASDLNPRESKYNEKIVEVNETLKGNKLKKKRQAFFVFGIVTVGLVIIVLSIFAFVRLQEKKAFETAKLENNLGAFQSYLDKFPKGKYLLEIKELQEDFSWEELKSFKSINAYKGYLNRNPKGKYVSAANKEIENLKFYDISGIPTDKVPPSGVYIFKRGDYQEFIKVNNDNGVVSFQIGESIKNLTDVHITSFEDDGKFNYEESYSRFLRYNVNGIIERYIQGGQTDELALREYKIENL